MKQILLILLFGLFLPQNISSSSLDLIKEEFKAWVVFKKVNEESVELYVAKEFLFNNDPIFFAYSFKDDQFLRTDLAEKLWDQFDHEYEEYLQSLNPE